MTPRRALLLVFVVAFAPAAAAQAPPASEPEGVTLRVAGQRGGARFRPGAPLPFAADIGVPRAASGRGRLEIVRLGAPGQAEQVLWTADLDLAPGGVHRSRGLAAPLDAATTQIEARWTSGGRTLTSRVPTTPVGDDERWVLVVADTPESAAALGAVRPVDAPDDWRPPWAVSPVDVSLCPPGWTPLAGADAVAVTCPVADLDPGVLVGLTRFVEAGGTLLIGGGERAAAIAAPLAGLAPVAPGSVAPTPIDPLARRFSRNPTSGIVLAAAATPSPGDLSLAGRDAPLFVARERGAGQVAWLAFDPGELAARNGAVASSVLAWLLARRHDVSLREGLTDPSQGYQGSIATWLVRTGPGRTTVQPTSQISGNPFAAPLQGLEAPMPSRDPVVYAGLEWCVAVVAVLSLARRRHRLGAGWAGLAAASLAAFAGVAWWAHSLASANLAARSLSLAVGALGAKSAAVVHSTAVVSPTGLAAALDAAAPIESCAAAHGWRSAVAEPTEAGARARLQLPARSPVRVLSPGLIELGDGVIVEQVRDTDDGLALRVRNRTPFDLAHLVVATSEGASEPATLAAGASLDVVVRRHEEPDAPNWAASLAVTSGGASPAHGLLDRRSGEVRPGSLAVLAIIDGEGATPALSLDGRALAIDGRCALALYGPLPAATAAGRSPAWRPLCLAACDPNDPTATDRCASHSPPGYFVALAVGHAAAGGARQAVAATLSAIDFPVGVALDVGVEFLGDVPWDHDLVVAPSATWELGARLTHLAKRAGWRAPAATVEQVMLRDPASDRLIDCPIVDGMVRVDGMRQCLRGRRLELRVRVSPALTDVQASALGRAGRYPASRDDVVKVLLDRLALVPRAAGEQPR